MGYHGFTERGGELQELVPSIHGRIGFLILDHVGGRHGDASWSSGVSHLSADMQQGCF